MGICRYYQNCGLKTKFIGQAKHVCNDKHFSAFLGVNFMTNFNFITSNNIDQGTHQPATMSDNMCTRGKRLFSIRIRKSARINHYHKCHAIKGNNMMMVMALKVHKNLSSNALPK